MIKDTDADYTSMETKDNEAGYTLTETIVSVAIVMILGCILVIGITVSMKSLAQSYFKINTALTVTRIDRFIRTRVDSLHIPYWTNSKPYIDSLNTELYRSKAGAYIISINVITDSRSIGRGLEVIYAINNHEIKTMALFPVVPLTEALR